MSLARRLWIYQAERFPLGKTVPLLAVFSAASLCVSAHLAGRPVPDWPGFVAAFVVAFLVFFQMRVCDEWKDLEEDRRFRPGRPIPRGLVSLSTVTGMGVASLPLTAGAVWLWHPPALWLLAGLWLWLALMTVEFGVPVGLKARPVLYLVSHMLIMPLLVLTLTGLEWGPGGSASPALWHFFALAFANGCVLEIGRKLWAPEAEIDGVDSYSKLWAPPRAALVWGGCVGVAAALLIALAYAGGSGVPAMVITLPVLVPYLRAVWSYSTSPTPQAQDRIDKLSGLWVLYCYATAGFLPMLLEVFP